MGSWSKLSSSTYFRHSSRQPKLVKGNKDTRNHFEKLFGDFELQPLDYHLFEVAFDVTPRQVVVVVQVDHHVEYRFYVVSA